MARLDDRPPSRTAEEQRLMFDLRAVRAALLADLLTFGSVAGITWFLGFGLATALVAGAVAGTLAMMLILAASGRAAKLGSDRPTPPQPRFPGPPANDDDATDAPTSNSTDDTDDTEDDRG